jgi:hypothetical protein
MAAPIVVSLEPQPSLRTHSLDIAKHSLSRLGATLKSAQRGALETWCDFLCETPLFCQATEGGARTQAERCQSLGGLCLLDRFAAPVQRNHIAPAIVDSERPFASKAIV